MMNLTEVGALLEGLPTGKGLFYAGANGPYFIRADGSILDKDGVMVAKPSEIGAAAYTAHVGYLPLTANVPAAQLPLATDAARGAVLAATKGAGDTVVCKIGTDGKLYVPAYPADSQYDMTALMVDVDSVESAKPAIYNDDDLWVDEGAAKIYYAAANEWVEITENKVVEQAAEPTVYDDDDYWVKDGEAELYQVVDGAWVLVTDSALTEAADAPAEPADGDYWLDTDDDGLFKYVTDAWVEYTNEAVVVAASEPVLYVNGDCWLDTDDDQLYVLAAGTWGTASATYAYQATAPTLYPVGYLLADEDTKKIYEREAEDWDAGTALTAGKLYTDGTDVYVFGSGSLAKI